MRILFIVGREIEYPRNDVLLRAFQRFSNVDVISVQKRPSSLLFNSIILTLRAIPKLLFSRYDLVFVGFYGHIIMLIVGWLSRAPVIFDAFLSTYDTLCFDRKVFQSTSIIGRAAFWLDKKTCRMAQQVLLDTPEHVQFFVDTFKLSEKKFVSIPVGCDEDIFHPLLDQPDEGFWVLFYTTYLPLHGVNIVIEAASQLVAYKSIRFRIIGNGMEYPRIKQMVNERSLSNIELLPSVPLHKLPEEIAAVDVCLGGHFAVNGKANRVIPGKIYQILAMGCPLIAADTPANRSILTHFESAMLCQAGNPGSLAKAILQLNQNDTLRRNLGKNGRELYEKCCSEELITRKLQNIVANICEGNL